MSLFPWHPEIIISKGEKSLSKQLYDEFMHFANRYKRKKNEEVKMFEELKVF